MKFRSKTSVIPLLIIMVNSLFAVLAIQQYGFAQSNAAVSDSRSLSASINPAGPVQLQINQSQVFVANASRLDNSITYRWSLETSSNVSAINQTNCLLVTHGNQAVFEFFNRRP